MNEDELLEFNYRSVRKKNDLVKLHRIFSFYNTTEPFYLDLNKASTVKPYTKNGVVSGTVITIEGMSYYAQEDYYYVSKFILSNYD